MTHLRIPCSPNYVSPSVVKFCPSTKPHLGCTKTNLAQTFTKPSSLHCLPSSMSSLTGLASLEAVLFDVDGTLCDSDPLHYEALREMLLKIGFNGGVPITEEFFVEKFSGKNNVDTALVAFPDDLEQGLKFVQEKEAMFQRLAREQLKPVKGLDKMRTWVEKRGLKRAAVTNSPRVNAELMISKLGLSDFFDVLIIGDECERGKPHPDPYLKALEVLKASKDHAFVFEGLRLEWQLGCLLLG
ncbi:haloacid dehalogenase-like hydrolase domain-containing protein Sgpp isoform X4 [Vigna umbellata]|uniref:haloacid dehalogenase-like hydrolase domain-containing protein Sgpp isoform X4 n=1 Tax=Vigna umbellata TaxID=87088 RepID=UPI001F5F88BF|nr:haloacid dehalogenase-like hydrolase domain-containing protein Sgpp isoform X4 [Vigna umbellata]